MLIIKWWRSESGSCNRGVNESSFICDLLTAATCSRNDVRRQVSFTIENGLGASTLDTISSSWETHQGWALSQFHLLAVAAAYPMVG